MKTKKAFKAKNSFVSNMTKNDVRGENGMPAHSTTDSAVLDLFFLLGTRPSQERVVELVSKAWAEDKTLTLKALFQSRDVRGGKGERDSFRHAIAYLAKEFPVDLVKLIPEFGRWDDLHSLVGTPLESEVLDFIAKGLKDCDFKNKILNSLENMSDEEAQKILASLV